MHIKIEAAKRISAFHLGEREGRDGKQSNASQVPKDQRKAYKNGYQLGQSFRKSK